jgi:hypothetical protein
MNLLKLNNYLHTFESELVKLAQERAEKSFCSDSELEQKTLIEETFERLMSEIGISFITGTEMPSDQRIVFTIARYLSVSGYGVEY